MTRERWKRVKEIFQSALACAPGERSAFLSSACRGDEQLRQEVESLIASDEKDGSFIDSAVHEKATELGSRRTPASPGTLRRQYACVGNSCGRLGCVWERGRGKCDPGGAEGGRTNALRTASPHGRCMRLPARPRPGSHSFGEGMRRALCLAPLCFDFGPAVRWFAQRDTLSHSC
jgi:hypothetical protein